MIGAYHPWFHEELMRRIAALRLERMNSLANGAAGDFADYRYAVGFFEGLENALGLADQIKREIDRA